MDNSKRNFIRASSSFTIEERHGIIKEYLEGKLTKTEIWYKYTGQTEEHGAILRWMRMYGYIEHKKSQKPRFNQSFNYPIMKRKYDDLDKAQLQEKLQELERLLEDSKLREEGYRIMIENAEKAYKIPIRKKPDTK